ncbi:hypothetical protein GCM10022254_32680 [Actinomadura meridiana]|uniref:Uncharacterized protein n=1 Tax=Actinomadura meridiana TaxID=559626 RepID=A0ABP8C2F9_9ACTN
MTSAAAIIGGYLKAFSHDAERCPLWCGGGHTDPDEHAGTVFTVQPAGPVPSGESRPGDLLLALRQDPGTGPQVVLSHEDRPEEYPLAPAEARKLAEHLTALAVSAEAAPTSR